MVRKLPTVQFDEREYTMDERLQEFRYLVLEEMPEFVPFNSEKGRRIMEAMENEPTRP